MADEIDAAQDRNLVDTQAAIAAARAADQTPPDVGCYDCHGTERRGKDCIYYAGCLEDWQRRDSAMRRAGRA